MNKMSKVFDKFRNRQASWEETKPLPKKTKLASRREELVFDEDGEFNPAAYAGINPGEIPRKAAHNLKTSRGDRVFSRKADGSYEVNAYDKKSAFHQAMQSYAAVKTAQADSSVINSWLPSKVEQLSDEKKYLIKEAANDPTGAGMRYLANELALPVKQILDYAGWAQKFLKQRKLKEGEIWRLALDVRASAYMIGPKGQGQESQTSVGYVVGNEFSVGSWPTIDITDILHMNFDGFARMQDTAKQEIARQIDQRLEYLFNTVAQVKNTAVQFSNLGIGAFAALQYQLLRHPVAVDKFAIHQQELTDIITNMSTQVDPVTERELILAGYVSKVMGSMIVVNSGITTATQVIPPGRVYALGPPDALGEMGVRQELTAEPISQVPNYQLKKGMAFYWIGGFILPNPRSVALGEKI